MYTHTDTDICIEQWIKAPGKSFLNPAWGSVLHLLLDVIQRMSSNEKTFINIINTLCGKVTFPIGTCRAGVWTPSSTTSVTLIPLPPPLMSALITRRHVIAAARVQQEVLGSRPRPLLWRLICPESRCRGWAPSWMSRGPVWWETRW